MSRPAALLAAPETARREAPLLSIYPPAGNPDEAERADRHAPETSEGKLVLTDELSAEIQRESERLEAAQPEEILRWTVERFAPKFTMERQSSMTSRM